MRGGKDRKKIKKREVEEEKKRKGEWKNFQQVPDFLESIIYFVCFLRYE